MSKGFGFMSNEFKGILIVILCMFGIFYYFASQQSQEFQNQHLKHKQIDTLKSTGQLIESSYEDWKNKQPTPRKTSRFEEWKAKELKKQKQTH